MAQPSSKADFDKDKSVKILVSDEDKSVKVIEVSRQLLARNSPEFKRRLVADKHEEKMAETLSVDDVAFNLLQHMISFINTDRIPNDLSLEDTVDLLSSAQRYEMESLVFQCECDLMKRIQPNTLCKLYEISKKIGNKPLRRWCIAFLRCDITNLTNYIAELSVSSLKDLLSLNRLDVPNEEVVLDIILQWAKAKELDLSHRDVGTLLDCVRWKFLTPENSTKFNLNDLAYYQTLADESKTVKDNVSVKTWNSSVIDTPPSSKTMGGNTASMSFEKIENTGSPNLGRDRIFAGRRKSKGSDNEEYLLNSGEDVYLSGEVFKRINATGRRYGTPSELESMYLKIFSNGKKQGNGKFRKIRKRSSCTSQDRFLLYASGDKNWHRTTLCDIVPFGNSLDTAREFNVDLPISVGVKFVTMRHPINHCFCFTVLRRVRLHQVVLELSSDVEFDLSNLEGYEIHLRKKTANLRKTFGTVESIKLWKKELTEIKAVGCDLYECICKLPRPIAMAAQKEFKVELSVGEKVVQWREFCLTFDQLKNIDFKAVKYPEQTTLAVKTLCFSIYD